VGYSQLFSSHVANAPQLGRTVEDAWRYGSKNLQNYKFFDTLDDAKAWAFSTARTVGFTVAEATKFKNSRTKTFLQFVTECGEDPATIMHKYPIVPPAVEGAARADEAPALVGYVGDVHGPARGHFELDPRLFGARRRGRGRGCGTARGRGRGAHDARHGRGLRLAGHYSVVCHIPHPGRAPINSPSPAPKNTGRPARQTTL
jgi:hypothetical protein